ncbi:MAG: ABC transporter permease subunit [Peptococcaceae bacterium]|nr:ABC transporter permease subunit [Peptococcaceae bacterium]
MLVQEQSKRRFGLVDIFVLLFAFGLLSFLLTFGKDMRAPFFPGQTMQLDLNQALLPYYAGRSLVRMFLAYGLALLFTFVYARVAAYRPQARLVMLPMLDILQSIPVLGFLSVSVTGLIRLFPGSIIGPELAAIFAIFTGQAWNMTFSFYYSLSSIPKEFNEVAAMTRISAWERFAKLEVPYGMIGLVWNSMMSFGGGWFFLAASEAITVLGTNIRLPGLGSYMATAITQGNMQAIYASIFTMIGVILLVDQLFWRPLVAWSQKYKLEQSEGEAAESWFLNLLRKSLLVGQINKLTAKQVNNAATRFRRAQVGINKSRSTYRANAQRVVTWGLILGLLYVAGKYVVVGINLVLQLKGSELLTPLGYGTLTFLRVLCSTALATLWTVPVGVAIGLNPKMARLAQPVVQIAASFPANMIFPFVTLLYLNFQVNMGVGSIPLMMLGTQWYILFNVIAGASAIPNDLKEASLVLGLRNLDKWKKLILPSIFPFLVTGWVTASGGAWNASIVAEIVSWQSHSLVAPGLGSYITLATSEGNWAKIIWGIVIMALFVVLTNRLVWRKLYAVAQEKYSLG